MEMRKIRPNLVGRITGGEILSGLGKVMGRNGKSLKTRCHSHSALGPCLYIRVEFFFRNPASSSGSFCA